MERELAEQKTRGSIVFNGEVYNHRALRKELASSWDFRSDSDTEVLLAGYLLYGPSFFPRANAMLAAALFEESAQVLCLVRDRLGKKPLYIYQADGLLGFASELKAFSALGLTLTESSESRAYYNWLRHVPGKRTIYHEVTKVPAASYLTFSLRDENLSMKENLFWDPIKAHSTRFEGNFDEAIDEFLSLLDDATRLRLDADVPVGLFLSGGIDSTLVATSVAAQHTAETTAFIFQAESSSMDESEVALTTARKLGLPTEIIRLSEADYLRQMDAMAYHYDDPCSPSSQIAMMALSEAAGRQVKVILTGDGGDEVFLGYPWTGYPGQLWSYRRMIDRIPGARGLAVRVVQSTIGMFFLKLACRLANKNLANLERKRQLLLDTLQVCDPRHLYEYFLELWPRTLLPQSEQAILGQKRWSERVVADYPDYDWDSLKDRALEEQLGALEMVATMRDEILVKVDRATMAYSLEARSPLLDYRIVEFGQSLPIEFKRYHGVHKRLLREACARRVGRDLAGLPKSGFGVPMPANMPPGPSDTVRWSREFDRRWDACWKS